MWYRGFLLVLLVAASASISCSKDDIIAAAAGDPDPGGMGVLGVSSAAVGAAVVTGLVSATAQGSNKPAPGGAVIGVFPNNNPVACTGGNIAFTGNLITDFTATINTCVSNGYTLSTPPDLTPADPTDDSIIGTMVLTTCDEDGESTDVPQSLSAVINATVVGGGQTLNITNLDVDVSNPVYFTGTGGTCALLSADITINSGSMSVSVAGQTVTTTIPSGTLNVTFVDGQGTTTLDVSGDVIVNAPCTGDGGYAVTVETTETLVFTDGEIEPSSGVITGNGVPVAFVGGTFPEICTGF